MFAILLNDILLVGPFSSRKRATDVADLISHHFSSTQIVELVVRDNVPPGKGMGEAMELMNLLRELKRIGWQPPQ